MDTIETVCVSPEGLFDSHAHYFDKRFGAEGLDVHEVLMGDVFGKGVVGVINVGTNNESNRECIRQAACYENMYAAVGIHPEDACYCEKGLDDELADLYELVGDEEKRMQSKIVAIGEIGLDYHCDGFDRELERAYFERQLCIAEKLDLPVIVHDRDAHGDCLEIVMRHSGVRGVFHSFSGSAEMARELVRRGWYISFSGVLTFKNARKTVEVASIVPVERMLVETDAPYLAPHPYRGRINHSGLMGLTAQKLSEIKGIELPRLTRMLTDNTRELFNIN